MKVAIELIRESRNRQFYTVRADEMLIATHVFAKPVAEMVAAAVTEYAKAHGGDAVLQPLRDAET